MAAVGAYPLDCLVYAGWSQSEDRTLFLEPGKKPFNVVVDDKPAAFDNLVALYSDSAAADGFHEFLAKRIEEPEHFPLKKGIGVPTPKSMS